MFGAHGPVSLVDVPAGRFHDQLAGLSEDARNRALKKLGDLRALAGESGRDEGIDREIILEGRRMDAADMAPKSAGEVERRLEACLQAGVVIGVEKDRLHQHSVDALPPPDHKECS